MNVYLEVQNNRTNTLRRLILWQPWYVRLARWFHQYTGAGESTAPKAKS